MTTSPTIEDAIADAWNDHAPPGTAVELIDDLGQRTRTRTRSEAWAIPSGAVLVLVDGRTGGYSLNRLVRCATDTPDATSEEVGSADDVFVDREIRRLRRPGDSVAVMRVIYGAVRAAVDIAARHADRGVDYDGARAILDQAIMRPLPPMADVAKLRYLCTDPPPYDGHPMCPVCHDEYIAVGEVAAHQMCGGCATDALGALRTAVREIIRTSPTLNVDVPRASAADGDIAELLQGMREIASRDEGCDGDEPECTCVQCIARYALDRATAWRFDGACALRVTNGYNPGEARMIASWREYLGSAPSLDSPDQRLADILLRDRDLQRDLRPALARRGDPMDVSRRDWYVATSVVQWLATNVGRSVLEQAGFTYQKYDEDRALRASHTARLDAAKET